MSAIHVRTLIEALDKPGIVEELTERTGYPVHMVFETIIEARRDGYDIQAIQGPVRGDPTTFKLTRSPIA